MKVEVDSHPGLENAITSYAHCIKCLDEKVKPNIAVGITVSGGIQIWCDNHDINVMLMMPGIS